ncbi:hypothetical protein U9M48_020516 [Paspalum notatum var. saurae]|uniref:Uncharacterized protein n=1 Tax=Paspalum notatum var. saurae TaxID=547442 RepID=A0AAQ3TGA0_PASNO
MYHSRFAGQCWLCGGRRGDVALPSFVFPCLSPPFSSNPAHHPVSRPGLSSSSSFARMFAGALADMQPITPKGGGAGKPKPTPAAAAAAAAAYYASLWSPRRLMQRAARAFRTSRSRRVRAKDVAEEQRA